MNKLLLIIVAIVAALSGIFIYQASFAKAQPEHALYYKQPRAIKPFVMTDHQAKNFDNSSLKGKWSLIFFGYTSCPDVCPTTLQELNFNYDELKASADNIQVLLVSVDPNRDTPEKLAQYISYFNDEFIALTAGHDVLFPLARNLGMMYSIADDTAKKNYLVDHSASLVLVNPNGDISAIFKPIHTLGELPIVSGELIASDFAKIVNLYDE